MDICFKRHKISKIITQYMAICRLTPYPFNVKLKVHRYMMLRFVHYRQQVYARLLAFLIKEGSLCKKIRSLRAG